LLIFYKFSSSLKFLAVFFCNNLWNKMPARHLLICFPLWCCVCPAVFCSLIVQYSQSKDIIIASVDVSFRQKKFRCHIKIPRSVYASKRICRYCTDLPSTANCISHFDATLHQFPLPIFSRKPINIGCEMFPKFQPHKHWYWTLRWPGLILTNFPRPVWSITFYTPTSCTKNFPKQIVISTVWRYEFKLG